MKIEALQVLTQDAHKIPFAILCLVLGALGVSLGFVFFPLEFGLIHYQFDFGAVLWFALKFSILEGVSFYLLGILAQRLFQSKLSSEALFRILCTASALQILSIFPYLGLVAGFLFLFLAARVFHFEAGLDWAQTVGLLGFELLFLWLFGTSFLGFYGLGLI